jgi:hypothetical protein
MVDGKTHRRYKALMGRQYAYKQHVPTPEYLREHGLPFTVNVHSMGELVVSVGHSHYVISGNSRGFSWSHVDPSTVERLDHSAAHYGSRQADNKPNTFSDLFHRSPQIMDALRANIHRPDSCWQQPEEQVERHVAATRTDARYHEARLAEGWRPDEIKPLWTPTMEQLEDPFWFTALMQGPGRRQGSLHVKMPPEWKESAAHNYGHVQWSPSPQLWKLHVTLPQAVEKELQKVVRVKVLRPVNPPAGVLACMHACVIGVVICFSSEKEDVAKAAIAVFGRTPLHKVVTSLPPLSIYPACSSIFPFTLHAVVFPFTLYSFSSKSRGRDSCPLCVFQPSFG